MALATSSAELPELPPSRPHQGKMVEGGGALLEEVIGHAMRPTTLVSDVDTTTLTKANSSNSRSGNDSKSGVQSGSGINIGDGYVHASGDSDRDGAGMATSDVEIDLSIDLKDSADGGDETAINVSEPRQGDTGKGLQFPPHTMTERAGHEFFELDGMDPVSQLSQLESS